MFELGCQCSLYGINKEIAADYFSKKYEKHSATAEHQRDYLFEAVTDGYNYPDQFGTKDIKRLNAFWYVSTKKDKPGQKEKYALSIDAVKFPKFLQSKGFYRIYLGKTPAKVKLKAGAGFFSRAEYQVKFSSPGYDDKIVPVNFKVDGWYFGNLFLGGVLGMLIIDPASGAMWKIESEFLNETLEKSTATTEAEMKIFNINDVPEDWKSHMVRVN